MNKRWITKKDKNGNIKHIPIEDKKEPYPRNEIIEDKKELNAINERIDNGEVKNHHKVMYVYNLGGKYRVVLTPLKDLTLYGFSKKAGGKWYDVALMVHTYKINFRGGMDEPIFYYHYWVMDKNDKIREYIKPIEDEETVVQALSKINLNEEKLCRLKLIDPVLVRRIEQARGENLENM